MNGFDRVAWTMPYAMFALGIGLVTFIVRNWRHVLAESPLRATRREDAALPKEFRRRARKETQL